MVLVANWMGVVGHNQLGSQMGMPKFAKMGMPKLKRLIFGVVIHP